MVIRIILYIHTILVFLVSFIFLMKDFCSVLFFDKYMDIIWVEI